MPLSNPYPVSKIVKLGCGSEQPIGVYIYRRKMLRHTEDSSMPTQAAPAELTKANRRQSARRDLLELAVGYSLIMATIWTVNPAQRNLDWLSFAWIVATS